MRKGQALVETAIITPLLIFILIGVFEVGYALRGYLVLVNATREAARFAVRPGYTDYTKEKYDDVITHAFDSMAGQIDFTGTILISVIRTDTQWVCNPLEPRKDCNCSKPYSPTLVMSPLTHVSATYKYPFSSTEITRLNFPKLVSDSIKYNQEFNCSLMKKGLTPSIDESIYVEMWYYQPQLFGFPLISNPLLDPIPMYTYAVFRKVGDRN